MQFHHHGYVSGDPRTMPADPRLDRPAELPDVMDVLVVGTGPAGMIAAAQLSRFPSVHTRIIDQREGRLAVGQADGIQARSMETFQAFGFAGRIEDEAYRITEMAFWQPAADDPSRIVRTGRATDDPSGVSEFSHLIVNQARVLDYFAEYMADSPTRMQPDYGWQFQDLTVEPEGEFPVRIRLRRTGDADGQDRVVRARYVIGADGARSQVRRAIGVEMRGDRANHAWGVIDALAVTDFPDIRTKCAIQSGAGGSILLIPREGGHLFRMYVDLGEVAPNDAGAVRRTPLEHIVEQANEILHPYLLDVRHVAWSSVYEVGHRLTDRFDDVPPEQRDSRLPRVFIAGDACHTHSAKAGQGMNVSMQDGFNIAWKLGHVLDGRAPAALLSTYSTERQKIAQHLIDFDREWSSMMAKRPEEFATPSELEDFYVRTAEFPAGFMTQYGPSMIVGSNAFQALAPGFPIGRRFHSAPVARVCDGNPVHLGHHATADGRWRVYVFAPRLDAEAVNDFAASISGATSKLLGQAADVGIDARYDFKVIYPRLHAEVELLAAPELFRPRVGPFDLMDYEKVYAVEPSADIFGIRDIHLDGAVVVVRPDQYVAAVLPVRQPDALIDFFARVRAGAAAGREAAGADQ